MPQGPLIRLGELHGIGFGSKVASLAIENGVLPYASVTADLEPVLDLVEIRHWIECGCPTDPLEWDC